MTKKDAIKAIVERVEKASKGVVHFDAKKDKDLIDCLVKASVRSELAKKHGLVVSHGASGKPYTVRRMAVVVGAKAKEGEAAKGKVTKSKTLKGSGVHEYIFPSFTDEVKALFACTEKPEEFKPCNIRAYGPTGSGKSVFFRKLAMEMFDAYYQVNGHAELDTSVLLGERTIVIDDATQQSFVAHKKGLLEMSMTHGLKRDSNGEVELDKDGKVQVVGKPAMLFIDEYAAIPSCISIALNRVMEIPDEPGESRVLELSTDSGRKVLSHPGFCICLSGNTKGMGLNSEEEAMYSAQAEQQDVSYLKRITASFPFGYNKNAEKRIMMQKLGDDSLVAQFLEFREKIRHAYTERTVETLFSTRDIVSVCDLTRVFTVSGVKEPATKALYRSVFTTLLETERKAWNEQVNAVFGVNMIQKYEQQSEMWMPVFSR